MPGYWACRGDMFAACVDDCRSEKILTVDLNVPFWRQAARQLLLKADIKTMCGPKGVARKATSLRPN